MESLCLLPGQVHLSTTVDVNITKPSVAKDAQTDTSTRTHLELKGMQMTIRDVSFYFHDNSLKVMSEVKGLMDIVLPPHGIDASITLCSIPSLTGKAERERRRGFHKIENVKVTLSKDTEIKLKKTNHKILISAFKPIVKNGLILGIEKVIASKLEMVFEMLDGIAWDVYQRAQVIGDTGVTSIGPKYASALLSEWRKMSKEPGMMDGVKLTDLGVVKDDEKTDSVIAVGTGPQVISGDKHGPRGPHSSVLSAKKGAKGVMHGVAKIKSFRETVDGKKRYEKGQMGWRSEAFSLKSDETASLYDSLK